MIFCSTGRCRGCSACTVRGIVLGSLLFFYGLLVIVGVVGSLGVRASRRFAGRGVFDFALRLCVGGVVCGASGGGECQGYEGAEEKGFVHCCSFFKVIGIVARWP